MTGERVDGAGEPESALVSAVVRVRGRDGTVGGAGFLVAPDLVLTCAHVVSDVLDLPRETVVESGAEVTVDLPLADGEGAVREETAQVRRWVPVRADQTGDVALLRLRGAIPGGRALPMADAESVWDHEARAVGFTDGHPDGIWHRGRFRGPAGRGWVQLSRTDGQAAYVERGFSGSPVWDDELGAAVGLVVAAQPAREAQQAFVLRTRALVREIPELAAVLRPAAPFRGLATFRESDTEVFFGRDEDVARTVTALRGERPGVTVYGPSGCGKSSLALAGVVPAMRRAGHAVLVVDCGRAGSPRAALATELFEAALSGRYGPARVDSAGQVDVLLGELGLVDAFHRATGRPPARLLVVLDQAEALLNAPGPELAGTIALLFPQRRPSGPRVLMTLRADFLDAALSDPHLGPALRSGATLPLTPMTRDQLHTVITEPLKRVPAVDYDPGLARRILDDAGGEPGVLPPLGFVLEQLWERRSAGRLRAATYEEIGGVSGALRRHAERAWRECVTPAGEDDARRLLTGLVRVLPGGEAPLRRALTRAEAGEEGWRLARALADRRLLVLHGGDGRPQSAELAHEALIAVWPTLAELVRADAGFLAGRAEVQHDLERWRKADRPDGLLPGEQQLAALEARLRGREEDLAEDQRRFLALARGRRRARRARVRAGWVMVALVLALIAGLGTFLVQESRVSAQREAEGRSRSLAVQSEELTDSNPGQAALAALAAHATAPTQEARSALLRRYLELRDARWVLTGAEGAVLAADMSADGAVTLVTTEGGRATLFVRTAAGRTRQEQLRLPVHVLSPAVSRDGRRIAYLRDTDGTVAWHEVVPSGTRMAGPARTLPGPVEDPAPDTGISGAKNLAFSPDARRLVAVPTVSTKRPVRVWDLETGRARVLPKKVAGLGEVRFGPDGNTLVARRTPTPEATRTSVVTVDIGAGTVRELAGGVDHSGGAVSADGTVVVVCRQGGPGPDSTGEARYQALRVTDGRVLRHHGRGPDTFCEDIAVDRTGHRFAVPGTDGEWYVVGTRGDGPPRRFSVASPLAEVGGLPLLGTAREPVVVSRGENAVTGWALTPDSGPFTLSPPVLLGDGSRMVVRLGRGGDRLRVMETEGEGRTLAEAESGKGVSPDPERRLAVNRAGTLVADVSHGDRVTVRALPSLRRVAEFTAAAAPVGEDGDPESLDFRFHGGDRLVTVSGTRVELWDARRGERLSHPFDLRGLRLTGQARPSYSVRDHREPGFLQVTVSGEPDVHAVDPRTGKEDRSLRIRLGGDLDTALFLEDRHHMAVLTRGSMVELWSVPPGRRAERTAGPLGPVEPMAFAVEGLAGSRFLLADGSSVRVLKADDPGYRETYEFTEDLGFLAVTDDGGALLHSPGSAGAVRLLRLDPAVWERELCATLGRGLTPVERGGLVGTLPPRICPA
ncbi:nSTAND1 domain-containing NTPase [Streptomyces uncialis]|uniref:nSTAND1 domain-containing NTPase n=1 Tax=Streptomyces uncialis TaxID=1048205 RepID=UPI003796C76B